MQKGKHGVVTLPFILSLRFEVKRFFRFFIQKLAKYKISSQQQSAPTSSLGLMAD